MPDAKLSALTSLDGNSLEDGDYILATDSSATQSKKVPASGTVLRKFIAATSAGAASLDFHEDTDNGSNRVRLQGPASTADVTVTLPSTTGTVQLTDIVDTASIITATTVDTSLQEAFNGSFSVNTNATTGSTETLTLQPAHKMTMDQNCTFTFPTPATSGHSFLLWLLGAFTPTFPASVDWHGSAAPTYVNDSLYGFATLDGGTTWVGSLIGSNLG